MGKWIDRFALLSLTATVLYLLFLNSFGSIPAACTLAFVCCALIIRRFSRRCPRFQMSTSEAEAMITRWAYGCDEETREALQKLTGSERLFYLSKHPSATLSVNDVFSTWKSHRGEPDILIACPCHADGRARTFAKTLSDPSVEILDAARLIPMIRRSRLQPPEIHRLRHIAENLRLAISSLPYRRSWRKSALSGILLMPVYLITGNPAYLFLSIGSLFLAGVSFRLGRNH